MTKTRSPSRHHLMSPKCQMPNRSGHHPSHRLHTGTIARNPKQVRPSPTDLNRVKPFFRNSLNLSGRAWIRWAFWKKYRIDIDRSPNGFGIVHPRLRLDRLFTAVSLSLDSHASLCMPYIDVNICLVFASTVENALQTQCPKVA